MHKRVLFILDLNGTILNRVKRPLPNNPADCMVRGSAVYFRPGHDRFLRALFQLGRVAVWTSAKTENAVPMVMRVFRDIIDLEALSNESREIASVMARFTTDGKDKMRRNTQASVDGNSVNCGRVPNQLEFLWTQTHCDQKRPENGFKPLFSKNLSMIYQQFESRGITAENTIIIDDSIDKLLGHEANHLAIPEFRAEVSLDDYDVLRQLEAYLVALVDRPCEDVREYLAKRPFKLKE